LVTSKATVADTPAVTVSDVVANRGGVSAGGVALLVGVVAALLVALVRVVGAAARPVGDVVPVGSVVPWPGPVWEPMVEVAPDAVPEPSCDRVVDPGVPVAGEVSVVVVTARDERVERTGE
jgi:hypothetical protein